MNKMFCHISLFLLLICLIGVGCNKKSVSPTLDLIDVPNPTPTSIPFPLCDPHSYFGYATPIASDEFGLRDTYSGCRYIYSSPATLSEPATIFSLSIPLSGTAGNIAMAIYTGSRDLIVESEYQPIVDGWNEIDVTPTFLIPDGYVFAFRYEGPNDTVFPYYQSRDSCYSSENVCGCQGCSVCDEIAGFPNHLWTGFPAINGGCYNMIANYCRD